MTSSGRTDRKILFYDLPCRDGGPLFSPNTWITRMALLHKGLPFETIEVTIAALGDHSPGSFCDRLGAPPKGRVTVPMIDVPAEMLPIKIVEEMDVILRAGQDRLLVSDSFDIAYFLDRVWPSRPSLFLPLEHDVDTDSSEFTAAFDYARMWKVGMGSSASTWSFMFELAASAVDRASSTEFRERWRSDEKEGQTDFWKRLMIRDRAKLLASTRRSLLPVSVVLSKYRGPFSNPESERALYLSSRTRPGLLDYILFARFAMVHSVDRDLSDAIVSESSGAARAWLANEEGGKWMVRESPGGWEGDVELPGMKEWTVRLLSAFDGHAAKMLQR